jgi:hypothetical protein
LADHALFKMVRYVLLRPLRPELEIQLEQFKEASSKPAQLKAFTFSCNCDWGQGVYIIRLDFDEFFMFHVFLIRH